MVLDPFLYLRHGFLVEVGTNRRPDSKTDRYDLAQGNYQASGYRLLWIRSSQKAEQDAQSRTRRVNQTLEGLRELQAKINTYHLNCQSAIEQAIQRILDEHDTHNWISINAMHRPKQLHSERAPPIPIPVIKLQK